jgi:hypothetical protein
VNGETGLLKGAAQGAVADTSIDPHGTVLRVQGYVLGQGVEQHVDAIGVPYAVEGVA